MFADDWSSKKQNLTKTLTVAMFQVIIEDILYIEDTFALKT